MPLLIDMKGQIIRTHFNKNHLIPLFVILTVAHFPQASISAMEKSFDEPVPFSEFYKNQDYKNLPGSIAFSKKNNPVIHILSGFDKIWNLGDPEWASGATVDITRGPADLAWAKGTIIDSALWRHNIQYVVDTTKQRTAEEVKRAYFDDRRHQSYSIISGLGPLAPIYKKGSSAYTTITTFPSNERSSGEDDRGNGAGSIDSKLGAVVKWVNIMRGSYSSSNPSKYHFISPRPWRMNNNGEVIFVDTNHDGILNKEDHEQLWGNSYPVFLSEVKVIPELLSSRKSEEFHGGAKDGGFPSGHTNAAYLAAIALAYVIPERFQELLTRASEIGHDRIVAGMHSPLDVMGGRIMSTALASAIISDPENKEIAQKAVKDARACLIAETGTTECYSYAHKLSESKDCFLNRNSNKTIYLERMTYGFPRDPSVDQGMIVPIGAEVLLETRFPYLDQTQRREILRTTSLTSGYPLIQESKGWGRINLVAAADGYAAFDSDVIITLESKLGGFHREDRWLNNITGKGRLTLKGDGILWMGGCNTYSGGTLVEGATLSTTHLQALGDGNVQLDNGRLKIHVPLELHASLKCKEMSSIWIKFQEIDFPFVNVSGNADITGTSLTIAMDTINERNPKNELQIIAAKSIIGHFKSVTVIDSNHIPILFNITYQKTKIIVQTAKAHSGEK